jgi:hypothetical protein
MSSTNFMKEFGTTLVNNGYRILPIKSEQKSPGKYENGEWSEYPMWQRHCIRDNFPQELDRWSSWPECGVGLGCGNVVCLDIDVYDDPKHKDYPRVPPHKLGDDAKAAHEIEALAREMLGDTAAKRIGAFPKRALFYRTETPFNGRAVHPLEVRGIGSRLVIAGIHPDTGEHYHWQNGSLTEIDRETLPEITECQAMAWLEAAYELVPAELRPARLAKATTKDYRIA